MSVTFSAQRSSGDWSLGTGQIEYESEGINMSQRNAADMLRLLGFVHAPDVDEREWCDDTTPVPDWIGDCDPGDFSGRILLARALLDNATDDAHGLPTVDDNEPGRARWIDLGREPGYLARRLGELQEVTDDAARNSALVVWG